MMLELELRVSAMAELVPALAAAPAFSRSVRPAQISPPELLRFAASQDSARLIAPELVRGFRVDLTVLVGLGRHAECEGGAIAVEHAGAVHCRRLEAGKCLIFSADTRVSIEPIARGELRLARCYVQSLVRNEEERRTLSDLERALDGFASGGGAPEIHAELRRAYFELERIWSDPALRSAPTPQ